MKCYDIVLLDMLTRYDLRVPLLDIRNDSVPYGRVIFYDIYDITGDDLIFREEGMFQEIEERKKDFLDMFPFSEKITH